MTKTRINKLLVASAASVFVFASCGSGDASTRADANPPKQTEAAAATTEAPAASDPPVTINDTIADADGTAAGCEQWVAADSAVSALVMGGQGDPVSVNQALDAAIQATDPEISSQIAELKDLAQDGFSDPEIQPSEDLLALYSDTVAWAGNSCAVPTLDVTALDYGYEGFPSEVDAGYTIVEFENIGNEIHEMFMVRFNDDTTESIDDLLELPEDAIFSKITPINAAFAASGESATTSFDISTPGRYAIVCVIPIGSVGEAEGQGAPHFTQGMFQEFTVA